MFENEEFSTVVNAQNSRTAPPAANSTPQVQVLSLDRVSTRSIMYPLSGDTIFGGVYAAFAWVMFFVGMSVTANSTEWFVSAAMISFFALYDGKPSLKYGYSPSRDVVADRVVRGFIVLSAWISMVLSITCFGLAIFLG